MLDRDVVDVCRESKWTIAGRIRPRKSWLQSSLACCAQRYSVSHARESTGDPKLTRPYDRRDWTLDVARNFEQVLVSAFLVAGITTHARCRRAVDEKVAKYKRHC